MSETVSAALIAEVVREVVARMSGGGSSPTSPVAVALSAGTSDAGVGAVREIIARGHAVVGVGVSSRADAATRATVAAIPAIVVCGSTGAQPLPGGVQALVAPELSLGDAAKLCSGILDDIAPEWLWEALAEGIPVLATPGHAFDVPSASGQARVTQGRRAGCERLGVQWCDIDTLGAALSARVASGATPSALHVPAGSRRALITETMVANLAEGTPEIVVPMGAVMTPLARDLAKRRGIQVRLRT
ncbi:MAG: hypothetical protein ABGY41_15455 [Candidatus Poribacteria bacterium]